MFFRVRVQGPGCRVRVLVLGSESRVQVQGLGSKPRVQVQVLEVAITNQLERHMLTKEIVISNQ